MMDLRHQEVALAQGVGERRFTFLQRADGGLQRAVEIAHLLRPGCLGIRLEGATWGPFADPGRKAPERPSHAQLDAHQDGDKAGDQEETELQQALCKGLPGGILCRLHRYAREQA